MINNIYLIRLAQLIEVFYFVCVCEWYVCEYVSVCYVYVKVRVPVLTYGS